jgi:hypothetical protein
VRCFQSLDQFRGDSALATYLVTIARNLSLTALAKRARARARFVDVDSDGVFTDDSDASDPLRDLLQQSSPTRFDAGFDDRVFARLAAAPALRLISNDESLVRTRRHWLPWLAAAAVLLAILDRRATRESLRLTASSSTVTTAIPDWSAYQ